MKPPSPPMLVDAASYVRDGFLVARNLYAADEMLDWKRRVVEILRARNKLDEPSGVVIWMSDQLDSFFRERMRDKCVVRILQGLVGDNVEFLSSNPSSKTTPRNSPRRGIRTGITGWALQKFRLDCARRRDA
jgi:hypothetical protein